MDYGILLYVVLTIGTKEKFVQPLNLEMNVTKYIFRFYGGLIEGIVR